MKVQSALSYSPLHDPSGIRAAKPRTSGLTMIIDKGLGKHAFEDLLETAAEYVDFIKLGFGTSVLYHPELLRYKVQKAAEHGVILMPGGTFFEVALDSNQLRAYFDFVKQIGFHAIEISDGTISIPREKRTQLIRYATEQGLSVITEYGKKMQGSRIAVASLSETVERDWEAGASYTIIEGRESGKNVGVYDAHGLVEEELVYEIVQQISQPQRLIWEAPQKEQQVFFLKALGRRANLGNIGHEDILSLEALRRGLRSDTFFLQMSPITSQDQSGLIT